MIRSEEMLYYNLVCSRESSWEIINKLGAIDSLHFEDMHPDLMATSKENNIRQTFFQKCQTMRRTAFESGSNNYDDG